MRAMTPPTGRRCGRSTKRDRDRQRHVRDRRPDVRAWDAGHLANHRLVATGATAKWSAGRRWRRYPTRGLRRRRREQVYVRPDRHGSASAGCSTVSSRRRRSGHLDTSTAIFPENAASLALHERCGFRCWQRERIGQIRGVWRDTLVLERAAPLSVVDRIPSLTRSRRTRNRGRVSGVRRPRRTRA